MQYSGIKIHVPTPEISELVQQKLFEEGCRWYTGGGVKHTCSHYLIVDSSYTIFHCGDDREFFLNKSEERQVHYLQVLTGDDSGRLFKIGDKLYYQLDGVACWVAGGSLESIDYNLDEMMETSSSIKLINVNQEEITMTNEMPELEAGKHVVRYKDDFHDDLMLIIDSAKDGLSGVDLEGDGWTDLTNSLNEIIEVHRIPMTCGSLNADIYDESTLIWQRNPNARRKAEIEKQIEELQKELESL